VLTGPTADPPPARSTSGPTAPDTPALRKARGAFFTPEAIADFLAAWAVDGDPTAKVLDPTCGEAVFLKAAGEQLKQAGTPISDLDQQVYGVDLHEASVAQAMRLLEDNDLDAHLVAADFFALSTPDRLDCRLPLMDAIVGNPPFIRYQDQSVSARALAARAALGQGVRLTGLASSWAALVVHACAFLKPEGRLAMVLPAELLTVQYAEAVRRWLKQRFQSVYLVMFERLQFEDALENVVLVVASGSGGSDAFSLHYVDDAEDLPNLGPFDHVTVTPADEGKWTEMLLSPKERQLLRRVADEHFCELGEYGAPELGGVTGANKFFTINESLRAEYGIDERHLIPMSPPGTKHLKGLSFTKGDWRSLRDADEAVWLLRPEDDDDQGLARYLREGEDLGIPDAYKCKIRSPWWRPPTVSPPDLFFTYMSHRYPRLIANIAHVTFVNSMHGIRLAEGTPKEARAALPLLTLNSLSMLGAEIHGRSYGGGILKMEPREAARLPAPQPEALVEAWAILKPQRARLDRRLRDGRWEDVVERIDDVLLGQVMGLEAEKVDVLRNAAGNLRQRRLGRDG